MKSLVHGWHFQVLSLWCSSLAQVAAAQSGVPRPDHVVIVIEENKPYDRIIGSPNAPYINSLAAQGALFSSSFGVRHPSQPNYLALFSGSTQGIGDDSCPHTFADPNLGSELLGAGLTFAGYSESMPDEGYKGCSAAGGYERKHNPWVNFTNVPPSANLPFTRFPTTFSELPTVAIVVPNQLNDMHDGSIQRGDLWLYDHIDAYVQWAATNNSLLILTWDEDDHTENNRIATVFVGPMVRPGIYCERVNHYNVLRTLLDMYELPALGRTTNADAITSAWLPESVQSPLTVEFTSPMDGTTLAAPLNLLLAVNASSSNSVISTVEFFEDITKLGEATAQPFQLTLSNVSAGAHCYVAKATDAEGRRRTSVSVQVRINEPDLTPPTVAITAPASGSPATNSTITLQGTASDDVAVARVEYQVNSGPFLTANGTSNWAAQVELPPGLSVIRVRSIDTSDNTSAPASRTIRLVVQSPLTIVVTGDGRVRPDLNGQVLEVGRSYSVTALPTSGNLFAGWSGGINSTAPRLVFIMQSNLVLQAAFVPNPFIALSGRYTGLFYEADGVRPQSSGYFSASMTDRGTFSASLQVGTKRYPFGGRFDPAGKVTNILSREALTVELGLDLEHGTDRITGRVTDGTWTAELLANRSAFNATTNPLSFAGKYTLYITGSADPLDGPVGNGVAAVTANGSGSLLLRGWLGDGTPFVNKATVSRAGLWPLYVPLYRGEGSALSWLLFTNGCCDSLVGALSWIKPSVPGAPLYSGGFTNLAFVYGSTYSSVDLANRLSTFTNATLIASGLSAAPVTNAVVLAGKNIFTGSNGLSVKLNLSTGLWDGRFPDPMSGGSLPLRCTLLEQRSYQGYGYVLGTNRSGGVYFGLP